MTEEKKDEQNETIVTQDDDRRLILTITTYFALWMLTITGTTKPASNWVDMGTKTSWNRGRMKRRWVGSNRFVFKWNHDV